MTRTSIAIKMLTILYGRMGGDPIPKDELARLLNTNPRNLIEYRKELYDAGYVIDTTSGKCGGYSLNRGMLLPVPKFSDSEKNALVEARKYLNMRNDFHLINEFNSALNNLACIETLDTFGPMAYKAKGEVISNEEKSIEEYLNRINQAIKNRNMITFKYHNNSQDNSYTVSLQPYTCFYMDEKYYVHGYATSIHNKDFRTYVISREKMGMPQISDKRFDRESDYKLDDYIGRCSVMKGEEISLVFKANKVLHDSLRARVNGYNYHIELDPNDENSMIVRTCFDNEIICLSYLLSLGENIEVLEPLDIREKLKAKAEEIAKIYANK